MKILSSKEKYLTTIAQLQNKGLKDVSFTVGDLNGKTEEEIYEELNRMLEAPDREDKEVLGIYSNE